MSRSHRRVLFDGVRALLIRGGAASGVIIGLLWALNRDAPDPSASCRTPATSSSIGECMGDTMLATYLPYVLAMAAGMFAGALIGWMMSRMIVGSPAGARRGRMREDPAASPLRPLHVGGRWITARYDGTCRGCGASIAPGDRVLHRPRHTVCGGCA
jgi:hypothetical protein